MDTDGVRAEREGGQGERRPAVRGEDLSLCPGPLGCDFSDSRCCTRGGPKAGCLDLRPCGAVLCEVGHSRPVQRGAA